MGLAYRPAFSLVESGNDVTRKIAPYLSSLSLTDNAGTESDRLTIDLYVPDSFQTPEAGAVLRLGLGFGDELIDKGQFVVDEVASSGPPRAVSITASASPMDARKQSGLLNTHKTRSWDQITLGDLVGVIAKDHGLESRVGVGLSVVQLDHLDQVAESDMSVLTRLAKRFGAVAKPAGGFLLFVKEGEGKTATGRVLTVVDLVPSDVTSWEFRFSSRNKVGSVVACYGELKTGVPKEFVVGSGEPVFRIVWTYPTLAEAKAAATARFSQVTADGDTVSINLPATPSIMALVAEGKINLKGFGGREDGEWRVKALRWTLGASGLQLSVNAVNGGA